MEILIVEDDPYISDMIELRLTLEGFSVDTAVNGEQAVNKAMKGTYSAILMDMHMPVMDGHEATMRLRELGYQGVIIAVTASAMSEDCVKATEAGCDGYISKPLGDDFEELLRTYISDTP